jgi:uncharacterized membrane protein YvbJ
MIYGACGIRNDEGAERCTHCGALLQVAEPKTRGNICRGCGFENPPHSKFCSRCGADLKVYSRTAKTHPSGKQKKSRKESLFARVLRWHPITVIMALFAILFIMIAAVQMIQNARTSNVPLPAQEITSADPKVETLVQAVASRYLCSCGTCQAEPLDICSCARAVEVRQFIRNKVQVGQSAYQVMVAVDQTYGWKKNDAGS